MDFHQSHHYTRPPPPAPWFSGQFGYQQWGPPPYPLHNHHHYPSPSPPQSHIPQSYSQLNQDWGIPKGGYHQGWEYPARNLEEDWAAKARAWAAAKDSTNNQHPPSQFTPAIRREEQNRYHHDQYLQNVDPNYSDAQSSYQQHLPFVPPPHRTPAGDLQKPSSYSSGYVQDEYLPYTFRDRTLAGDSNAAYFPHQESLPSNLTFHKQEVPSRYSSIAGKEEALAQNENFYNSVHFSSVSTPQHHVQPPLPAVGRSVLMEQPHYAFGNQSAEPTTALSDQPLDFVHRFSRDRDSHVQPNYSVRDPGPISAVPSIHAWIPPAGQGAVYPPAPPVRSSQPQVDLPFPGHSAPIFGRMPGQSFQPTIPLVSSSFGIDTGNVLHPTATFTGDAYGASVVSEHPKKASVPNWLREEISKNNAGISTSDLEFPKDEIKSIQDQGVDKYIVKGDQADSKSIDSSRSTEEDDDDEDDVEAARTAAVNLEIKRVLTEVFMKVTDELFDEIATKVLGEDDLTVEVDNKAGLDEKVSPSTPAVQIPKASAKVLIPAKAKETDLDAVSKKSTSSSPEDVLGLGSYMSDDEKNDAIKSSGVASFMGSTVQHQPTINMPLEVAENGSSQAKTEEHSKTYTKVRSSPGVVSPNRAAVNHDVFGELSANRASRYSSKEEFESAEDEAIKGSDTSKSKVSVGKKAPVESSNTKKSTLDGSQDRDPQNKPDRNDRHEIKVESVKDRKSGKERTDDRNGSKEKMKEQGYMFREKANNSDIRKDRKETERDRRVSGEEDNDSKRERSKEENGDRLKHKPASDLSRHKRHRSSSVGSRERNNKDKLVVSRANDSSGSSDDSKSKVHSKRRNLLPSPVRSRRPVSRPPHSRHSQRRHSPYSSLETTRGRR